MQVTPSHRPASVTESACQRIACIGLTLAAAVSLSGCYTITRANDAIPASRIDNYLFTEALDDLVPVPMTALGQPKPEDHLIGAGDTLAIYVFGVLPPSTEETVILQRSQPVNQRYYPPHGSSVGPTTGVPVSVNADGTVDLPLLDAVDIKGLTLSQATRKLKDLYTEEGLIKEGRERVSVQLITPRVNRIVVIREDTPATTVQLNPPGQVDHIHRGSGETIDLPIYENDVLHALAQTGGLPGTDAPNEIWVFRQGSGITPTSFTEPVAGTLISSHYAGNCGGEVTRIPLKGPSGCPLPFSTADVVLNEGDVVYVPRREEYFLVGGLLPGARIPIPRDHNIDVIEAVALATGSTGGPLGASGLALAAGTPGYVLKPSRAVVIRKLPDGREIQIRVDLGRALTDPKERIKIQSGDLVMLHCKPLPAALNTILNLFNLNVLLDPTEL